MKIKVLLISDRTVLYEVEPYEEARALAFLDGSTTRAGKTPPGYLSCLTEQGWPLQLNLTQCVTIEQAAS